MDKILCRILITDDNRDIHDDIKYILDSSSENTDDYSETKRLKQELFGESASQAGNEKVTGIKYRIDDAYQGEEAVRMVRTAMEAGDPYSLVFMDVRMPPGIDGIETVERIWKIDPDVGIVICTAYSDYSWDQIVLKLGQNDNLLFIKKPFDSVSLKQIALAMTTKWSLKLQVNAHIGSLEKQVEIRTNELTELVGKLKGEITLRKEKEKQLAYSAHYDSLTELLNRRSFYSSLSEITGEGNSRKDKFALFYLDLDDFKNVNDVFGHDTGDKLLIEVAGRIRKVLAGHAMNIPDYISENGMVRAIFRLGGDEFTAIVDESRREELEKIAQKLIDAIKVPFIIFGNEIDTSCCIGISICQQDSLPSETLLKFADLALYEAKRVNGIYRFYDQSETLSYLNELKLEKDLRKAVQKKQIDVFFQRLVNTREETIGVQALARWSHPESGELGAEQFIHIAEKSDLIISLGAHILRLAAVYMNKLHNAGNRELFVLVNCTAKEFYYPGFVNIVKNALKDSGLEPSRLKLNLDDKFSFQATPVALSIIKELNDIGVQFALNGFESDYPAFVFLQKVPRDTIIKLDKAYVKNIVNDERNRRFLMALMDIIMTLDLRIIVSGIETLEQKKLLEGKDCILQGYHYNIPQPFDKFMDDLKSGV
ncbi:MAG TPA: EAL domain-containing protein [Clostridia bacterium]|nr:EAL domain-containing protein [Clostridia bacterium]